MDNTILQNLARLFEGEHEVTLSTKDGSSVTLSIKTVVKLPEVLEEIPDVGSIRNIPRVGATPQLQVSADETRVPPSDLIIDDELTTWTIGGGGETLRDGVHTGAGYVNELLWYQHSLYGRVGTDWYQFIDSAWTFIGTDDPTDDPAPPVGDARYVSATAGSNSNDGTVEAPWATIPYALSQMLPTQILYLREGVFSGSTNRIDNSVTAVPSGNSWLEPITISAFPGETVTIQQAWGYSSITLRGAFGSAHYLIFQDIIFDGVNNTNENVDIIHLGGGPSEEVSHIRFLRCEVKNAWSMGLTLGGSNGDTPFNEIVQCVFHHNGLNLNPSCLCQLHAIYCVTSRLLIEDSIFHDNYGTPINCYDNAGSLKVYENIIRGNIVYDNHALPGAGPGANLENAGILVAWGDGNQIYNNFCFRNDIGFQIYTNASNTKVYHNTAYGNVTSGFHFQYMLGDAILKNNIAYNNPTPVVEADSIGGVVIASNNITADPSFVNAAAGDFRLQSGSVARNAGANLLAVVPTDANGVARDTVPDCGALEFV